jgi:integrase
MKYEHYTNAGVRKRKGRPGWQGFIKSKDPDGKWKTKYASFPDVTLKRDANAALSTWREKEERIWKADQNGNEVARATNVAEYVSHYIDTLEKTGAVAKSTVCGYRFMLKHIKADPIGSVRLEDLTAEDAERFMSHIFDKNLQAGTARKAFNVLHGAIRHAAEVHLIPYDPLSAAKRPKLPKKDPNVLDAIQRSVLVKFLDSTGTSAVNVGVSIALYTGMREGEICGLRWSAVDFDAMTIRVCRAIARDGGRNYEKDTKTGNSMRTIPLAPKLAGILERRKEACRLECSKAAVPFKEDMYVVGSVGDGTGSYMDPHHLWASWKTLARSLELVGSEGKTPSFHDLRHTFATVAIAAGADVKSVQFLLGHASAKTTLDIYAGCDSEAMRKAAFVTVTAIADGESDAA